MITTFNTSSSFDNMNYSNFNEYAVSTLVKAGIDPDLQQKLMSPEATIEDYNKALNALSIIQKEPTIFLLKDGSYSSKISSLKELKDIIGIATETSYRHNFSETMEEIKQHIDLNITSRHEANKNYFDEMLDSIIPYVSKDQWNKAFMTYNIVTVPYDDIKNFIDGKPSEVTKTQLRKRLAKYIGQRIPGFYAEYQAAQEYKNYTWLIKSGWNDIYVEDNKYSAFELTDLYPVFKMDYYSLNKTLKGENKSAELASYSNYNLFQALNDKFDFPNSDYGFDSEFVQEAVEEFLEKYVDDLSPEEIVEKVEDNLSVNDLKTAYFFDSMNAAFEIGEDQYISLTQDSNEEHELSVKNTLEKLSNPLAPDVMDYFLGKDFKDKEIIISREVNDNESLFDYTFSIDSLKNKDRFLTDGVFTIPGEIHLSFSKELIKEALQNEWSLIWLKDIVSDAKEIVQDPYSDHAEKEARLIEIIQNHLEENFESWQGELNEEIGNKNIKEMFPKKKKVLKEKNQIENFKLEINESNKKPVEKTL